MCNTAPCSLAKTSNFDRGRTPSSCHKLNCYFIVNLEKPKETTDSPFDQTFFPLFILFKVLSWVGKVGLRAGNRDELGKNEICLKAPEPVCPLNGQEGQLLLTYGGGSKFLASPVYIMASSHQTRKGW